MSILAAIIQAYRIPPERVQFWDRTFGRRNAAVGINSSTVLAEHITQPGLIGVLTHWQVYYRPLPAVAPALEGDLHFLTDIVGTFFHLSKNGAAIPYLNEIRQLSSPWGGNLYPADGSAFYMSEFGASGTTWHLGFDVGPVLPADSFEVAGRIIGFDFPVKYLDRSEIDSETDSVFRS